MIYRATRDGWEESDFNEYCLNKGKTLTFVKSSRGYLCAGYTSIAWMKYTDGFQNDIDARLFALTNIMAVYKPRDPKKAIYHGGGFSFGGALQQDLMYGPTCGSCWTGESGFG